MRSLHVVAENLSAYKFVLKKVFGQEAQVESLAFFFARDFLMGVASHFSYGCAPGILPKTTAHFIRLLEKGFMRGRLNHHSNQ